MRDLRHSGTSGRPSPTRRGAARGPEPGAARQGTRHRSRPHRHLRRRARAPRGCARRGQDDARQGARQGVRRAIHPCAVHARSAAGRHHRLAGPQSGEGHLLVSPRPHLHEHPARRRDQPRLATDAGRAPRGHERVPGDRRGRDSTARRRRSSSSRRRTRRTIRAPTRSPRPSSTASSSASRSGTRARRTSLRCSSRVRPGIRSTS